MPPSPIKNRLLFAVLITAITALFCELGMWLFRASGQTLTLIWPATGVCIGIFYRWGRQALPWVILGHTTMWLRFPMSWTLAIVPVLYTAEAWLASYLSFGLPLSRRSKRSAMDRTAWQLLVVPWLACLPCAAIIGWAATASGRFPASELPTTLTRIAMSHVHGILAFGPLTVHLLRRDFNFIPGERTFVGVAAMTGALCLMVLVFTDHLRELLGLSASAYLAFPFVIMVGVACRPQATALFITLWCLGTTIFTNMGTGPFSHGESWGHLVELGLHNLIICSTAYLLSVGSTRYIHQLRRNDLTLQAAGVEIWEWNSNDGLHSVSGDRDHSRVRKCTGSLSPLPTLALLSGHPEADPGAIPERWKLRVETNDPQSDLLMSAGRVTSRNRDGTPQRAIGMLQDLSAIRKAEEALVALGHQRAQLRSLQTRLNPHFLFNALNATRALIHLDPKKASDAVTTLARLLRANLRNTDRPLIPLADEMQIVHDLLTVSGMRFGDRLQTRISVDPTAEDALVPPMIVFNLVENALLHGIEKSSEAGTIALDAKIQDEELVLSVSNPGRLDASYSPGVGTKDAKQRLELIFGTLGRFRMFQSNESTVLAEIVIPFRDYESAHC